MPFHVLKNIKLNLLRPELTVVHGKQYDNSSRLIAVQLFEDNTKWYAPENTLGVISYIKPDGNYGFYDETDLDETAVVFDENDRSKATLILSTQVLTCAGKVKVEVNFYDQQKARRLSSFAFTLDVEKSTITQEDLTSSSEFRILAEQINEVLTAAANLSGLTAGADTVSPTTDADAVVSGGTGGNPYHIQFKVPRGYQGEKGDPPTLVSSEIKYQQSSSGTVIPTGTWLDSPPTVTQGNFLWTRTTQTFETGSPIVTYTIAYAGVDGQGSPGSATPLMDGTPSAGSANAYAREDHVHPSDTSRASASDVIALQKAAEDKVLYLTFVAISATTGDIATVSNAAITANYVLAECVFASPSSITTDVTWTTAAGSLTLNGTCLSATTANIVLIKKDN